MPTDPPPSRPTVSVIGRKGCARAMRAVGIDVISYPSIDRAKLELQHGHVRLIVVQSNGVGREGIERAVRMLRRQMPLTDVVLWAPDPTPGEVRAAFRGGVADAVFGPASDLAETIRDILDGQQLLPRLERLDARRRRKSRFERMVSRSSAMWDVFDMVVRVAPTDATVLILGETGTGKELVARAVHRRSKRQGRLVAINCGAVPEPLIDSELFGHVKGAFTGATHAKRGLFRHAEGGTLFLDEIGNIPLGAQYRLLRVLQENVVRPVGGDEEIPIDVRLVAATNAPLLDETAQGRFREDLYYRLNVIRIEIPPLRARREDILFLFGHFCSTFARSYNVERPRVTESFVDAMLAYDWPGNVRELENYSEKLTLTHPDQQITASDFELLTGTEPPTTPQQAPSVSREWDLEAPLEEASHAFEKRYLEDHLRRHMGRVGATAEAIGINRRTLLRKMNRHGIDPRAYRS